MPCSRTALALGLGFALLAAGGGGGAGAATSVPVLVKDIDTSPAGRIGTELAVAGGTVFFVADDGGSGTELWKIDEATGETALVKNIHPNGQSLPSDLTALGSTLFFVADDGTNGRALWKSDGTQVGTVMVKDIVSGATGTAPTSLTAVGETLFFRADDGTHGEELWKSDGTEAGTVMVKDIDSGAGDGISRYGWPNAVLGDTLYFAATDPARGLELWKSDGAAAGTVPVGGNVRNWLTVVGSTLFFDGTDATNGTELWKSDGTASGTVLVKDIVPGTPPSGLRSLTAVGSTLFFVAGDATNGDELWKSDGTASGTVMVADIVPGSGSSQPDRLVAAAGRLFFVVPYAVDSQLQGLWTSDGTSAGTALVHGEAYQGTGGIAPVGSALLFASDGQGPGGQSGLWKSDGTVSGTVLVSGIYPGIGRYGGGAAVVGATLYFSADDGTHGPEIWKSDGTSGGTVLAGELSQSGTQGSLPMRMAARGADLFFSADDRLWKSDGTDAGTIRLSEEAAGPREIVALGGGVLFVATSAAGPNDEELWKSDGTAAGTGVLLDIEPGPEGSRPSELTVVGDKVFFRVGSELWSSDGTTGGTALVKAIGFGGTFNGLTAVGDMLLFSAYDEVSGVELWKSDGTAAGTVLVKDILPGAGHGSPSALTAVGDTLFFQAADGVHGAELWKSDGTQAGTVLVADVVPGAGASAPWWLTAVGDTLFFSPLGAGGDRDELWKSDGTAAGTVRVADVRPGADVIQPTWLTLSIQRLAAVNGRLFFVADDGTHGLELWTSDGTAAGTVLVRDIRPGPEDGIDRGRQDFVAPWLTAGGVAAYFAANDGTGGLEFWESDGTAAGTVPVHDVHAGSESGAPLYMRPASSAMEFNPRCIALAGATLFVAADDGVHGVELWKFGVTLPPPPPPPPPPPAVMDLAARRATERFGQDEGVQLRSLDLVRGTPLTIVAAAPKNGVPPTIDLASPTGQAIDLSKSLRTKKNVRTLAGLRAPESGRYRLAVTPATPTDARDIVLTVTVGPPRFTSVVIDLVNGQTAKVLLGALPTAKVTVRVAAAKGSAVWPGIVAVRDAQGTAVAETATSGKRRASCTVADAPGGDLEIEIGTRDATSGKAVVSVKAVSPRSYTYALPKSAKR